MPDTELLRPAPAPTWRDRVVALRAFAAERPGAVVGAVVGLVVLALAGLFALRTPSAAAPPTELSLPVADGAGDGVRGASSGPTTTVAAGVVVHVAGAVVRPGLLRLRAGARVADAVDAAGGLRPDADLDRLNLAAPLSDGQRVWVPIVGQDTPPEAGPAGGPGAGAGGGGVPAIVDLNTATAADLELLPGIGPTTAQAIVDQRRRVGRFRSVDDLLDVRGIGPSKLAALRDRVRV